MTSGGDRAVPRFRHHLRVVPGATEVHLFSELGVTVLHGRDVAGLAALLDGRRDLAEIVAARPEHLAADRIPVLLDRLVDAGVVTVHEQTDPADPAELAWWDACGVRQPAPGSARAAVTFVGAALDPALVTAATSALAVASVQVETVDGTAPADGPGLGVVFCGDYLDPGLAEIDAVHRAAGRPWLLARIDGTRAWIGPFFRPDGACWCCLADRLTLHRHPETVARQSLGRGTVAARPVVANPAAVGAAAHLVALEVGKWSAGVRHDGQRCVTVIDTTDLSAARHELRARPQCPRCGDPELVATHTMRPVQLRPAPKTSSDGGGDRVLAAADMLRTHRHLISPVTGVVKQVVPDPHTPGFAHSYRSGANPTRRTRGMETLRSELRGQNGGKGLTALDAEVGALCEAVERYSGTAQGDELRIRGTLASLGPHAVDPRSCLLFGPRQYATRLDWNARHGGFNHVPPPVDPDVERDWTPLWSLTGHEQRYLPTAMLYFGADADPTLFADSNGCAAGGTLEDAVLQGVLELVERDAVAIWWYNRLRVPQFDLAALPDPRLAAQAASHATLGRSLHVLDVTSDLGVPTAVAVSYRPGVAEVSHRPGVAEVSHRPGVADGERILLGFGAHLDPTIAVRRAITELNQMLPTDAADPRRSDDPDWRRWACHATVANQPHLLPVPGATSRWPGPDGHCRRPDVRDDVEALVATLAGHGLETLVLDQTRPDIGMPVVRVVVPGMRSMWARYAPGRLFEVPVGTGAVSVATPYEQLNPMPLFL